MVIDETCHGDTIESMAKYRHTDLCDARLHLSMHCSCVTQNSETHKDKPRNSRTNGLKRPYGKVLARRTSLENTWENMQGLSPAVHSKQFCTSTG